MRFLNAGDVIEKRYRARTIMIIPCKNGRKSPMIPPMRSIKAPICTTILMKEALLFIGLL